MDKTIRVSEAAWDYLKREAHDQRCTIRQLVENWVAQRTRINIRVKDAHVRIERPKELARTEIDHIA